MDRSLGWWLLGSLDGSTPKVMRSITVSITSKPLHCSELSLSGSCCLGCQLSISLRSTSPCPLLLTSGKSLPLTSSTLLALVRPPRLQLLSGSEARSQFTMSSSLASPYIFRNLGSHRLRIQFKRLPESFPSSADRIDRGSPYNFPQRQDQSR